MTILVTGGAGYIGSHTVRQLRNEGRDVVVLDSLERGSREALLGTPFVQGDISNADDVARAAVDSAALVIAQVNPRMPRTHGDGIVHSSRFAAAVLVDEALPEQQHGGIGDVERLGEDGEQSVGIDTAVEAMDRIDAELTLDQFGHVGERQLARAAASARRTFLVAEGAADCVAMVSISDQHRVRGHRSGDCRHPGRVGHSFDLVEHAVLVVARPDRFAWSLE